MIEISHNVSLGDLTDLIDDAGAPARFTPWQRAVLSVMVLDYDHALQVRDNGALVFAAMQFGDVVTLITGSKFKARLRFCVKLIRAELRKRPYSDFMIFQISLTSPSSVKLARLLGLVSTGRRGEGAAGAYEEWVFK